MAAGDGCGLELLLQDAQDSKTTTAAHTTKKEEGIRFFMICEAFYLRKFKDQVLTRMIHSAILQSTVFTGLLFTVFAMTAVIWVVQLIIYPLFTAVGEAQFLDYHNRYSTRISIIVIPLMGCQLVSALTALVLFWNDSSSRPFFILGALLTLSTWLVTFIIQVPQHAKLGNRYDKVIAIRLVKENWIRTCLWSAHSVLLIIQLLKIV